MVSLEIERGMAGLFSDALSHQVTETHKIYLEEILQNVA